MNVPHYWNLISVFNDSQRRIWFNEITPQQVTTQRLWNAPVQVSSTGWRWNWGGRIQSQPWFLRVYTAEKAKSACSSSSLCSLWHSNLTGLKSSSIQYFLMTLSDYDFVTPLFHNVFLCLMTSAHSILLLSFLLFQCNFPLLPTFLAPDFLTIQF